MKKDNLEIKNLNYLIFFNNRRGMEIMKLFYQKKFRFDVVITKKNLNIKILKDLNKLKIKYLLIDDCENLDKKLKKNYDIFIVAGFPHIFKKNILNLPKYGSINLHAGPLPKYRGGSPLNWQIINNEKKIGISIIKMNEKIDGGKILIKKYFNFSKKQNILDAHKKANYLFKKNIFYSISNLLKKKYLKKVGKENYFKQRNKKDSEVKLNEMTAKNIINLARSQYPLYTPPFIYHGQQKIVFKKSFIEKNIKNKNKYTYFFKCKRNYIGIMKKDLLRF